MLLVLATRLGAQQEQEMDEWVTGVLRRLLRQYQPVDLATGRVLVQPLEELELVRVLLELELQVEVEVQVLLVDSRELVGSVGVNSEEWEEVSVNRVRVVHLAVAWADSAGVRVPTEV